MGMGKIILEEREMTKHGKEANTDELAQWAAKHRVATNWYKLVLKLSRINRQSNLTLDQLLRMVAIIEEKE